MKFTVEQIAKDIVTGDRRSLARALSIVEDGGPNAAALVRKLYLHSGKAHLIGITGSPGVGKSTLVDALITEIRKEGLKVGVLAIDPSSPFTGGAILGDRIRMQEHTMDRGVFIRSMANRGHSGGTALATYDAVRMMEAAGIDVVIIETVGVGQSELAIARTADTTVLVLMPGSGDDVQAIKSGIMEIGDVFVVNKGDMPGANKTYAEILASLELQCSDDGWRPACSITNAEVHDGVDVVWDNIKKHRSYLESSGKLTLRRQAKMQAELEEMVAAIARENLQASFESQASVKELLMSLVTQKIDPHSAAQQIIEDIFRKGPINPAPAPALKK